MRPDGSERRVLADNAVAALTPAWSPSGRLLAYGCRVKRLTSLCMVARDGTYIRRLAIGTRENRVDAIVGFD
jgi:hypothetical protein